MRTSLLRMIGCIVLALALAGAPARASLVRPGQDRCQISGPFATLVSAIEAAQEARARGANAETFRTPDGYFVRAC